jgi:hypothetical protein
MPEFSTKSLFAVSSICLLSACANPVQQDIVTFGETAEVLAASTGDIYQRHRVLVDRNNLENAAWYYSDRQDADFDFPPASTYKAVNAEIWNKRIQAMAGIRAYAKALADLNDPAAAIAAEGGLTALGDAIAAFPGSNVPQPATRIASGIVAAAIRTQNASVIRATIADVHPLIAKATQTLGEDFKSIQGAITDDNESWKSTAKRNLINIRNDPRINTLELQQAYRNAAERHSANEALVSAYGSNLAALEKFEAAHQALRDSRDNDRALSEFLSSTRSLAENFDALRMGG